MAICPTCKNEVTTPSFLNLSAWRNLVCRHCKARLEMKPPRSFLLAPVMAPLFVLGRHRPAIAIIAFVYMFATFFLILLESLLPKVQLRKKPLPEPSIRLNIDGPPNQ
jgi:DNA-directed RNA polymerase subunit RPC12/RpoP